MSSIPGPGPRPSALVKAFDHLAGKIVRALQQLFGFQYSRNAEHYIYGTTVTTGATDAIGTTYNTAIRITQEADFIATRLNGPGPVVEVPANMSEPLTRLAVFRRGFPP